MSRKDGVVVASRALALLLTVWALAEAASLPDCVYSFLRYNSSELRSSNAVEYWRHYHLIVLGFVITKMIGFALVARWLYKGGPEVEELLLPSDLDETVVQS